MRVYNKHVVVRDKAHNCSVFFAICFSFFYFIEIGGRRYATFAMIPYHYGKTVGVETCRKCDSLSHPVFADIDAREDKEFPCIDDGMSVVFSSSANESSFYVKPMLRKI